MQWFNRFLLVVLLEYILIHFIVENDHSLVALVVGRTRSWVTLRNTIFWLYFLSTFTIDSNNFVIDILLVPKKAAN